MVDSLMAAADSWRLTGGLAALTLVLTPWPSTKALARALFFPALLLFSRKLLLFLPIVGSLTTSDSVVFWCARAYLYFLLLHLVVLVAGLCWVSPLVKTSGAATLLSVSILVLIVAGFWFLGLNHWSAYLLPLTWIGLVKVWLVSPAFLVLVFVGLGAQLAGVLMARGRAMRELNQLLLLLLFASGLIQFASGGLRSFGLADIEALWDAQSKSAPASPEFADIWRGNWGAIESSGINEVIDIPRRAGGDHGSARPSPSWKGDAWMALWGGALGWPLLTSLLERGRGQRMEWAPPIWKERAVGACVANSVPRLEDAFDWFPVQVLVSTLLVATAAVHLSGSGWPLKLGLVVLSLAGLGTIGVVSYWSCLVEPRQRRLRALVCRDCRGLRALPNCMADLVEAGAASSLTSLADRTLLLWLAEDSRERTFFGMGRGGLAQTQVPKYQALLDALRPTPGLHVELALCVERNVRRAALLTTWPRLWDRALRRLVSSDLVEGQLAAIQCPNTPRPVLVDLMAHREAEVRAACWKRIAASSDPREAVKLSTSPFPDVIQMVVGSSSLPRWRLVEIATHDENWSLRTEAWNRLLPVETSPEAVQLSHSLSREIRRILVGSPLLPAYRLLEMAAQDQDRSIRSEAWTRLQPLSGGDAESLILSPFADTKRDAIESGLLSKGTCLRICRQETDVGVLRAALAQVIDTVGLEDLMELRQGAHPLIRAWAHLRIRSLRPKADA